MSFEQSGACSVCCLTHANVSTQPNVGCNRSSSRDSCRHFHPCAVLGVLAWVTVNFLTGKTTLVFCYVGVSGREAHIWGSSVHRGPVGKDLCLLPAWGYELESLVPKRAAKINNMPSRFSHTCGSIIFIFNTMLGSSPWRCFPLRKHVSLGR